MADKPILFSGPMDRALLAGTKTQTRRALNPQPPSSWHRLVGLYAPALTAVFNPAGKEGGDPGEDFSVPLRVVPSDRLYVREHWRTVGAAGMLDATPPRDLEPQAIWYIADGETPANEFAGKFRQGMHMPRWASRLTLTVTDVRVERLQDISGSDALAEGIDRPPMHVVDVGLWARAEYAKLWNSINGAGAWDANPWVAAYTFTVALGNIDDLAGAA